MFNALYSTNFLSTLNDNYQKMLGMLVVTTWVSSETKPLVIAIAGAALVLPYIFCSPLANRAAQVFGKQRVVRVCKLLELPIVLLSVMGFLLKDTTLFPEQKEFYTPLAVFLVIFAIFLIGVQSSMYSPAKYGLIRDIGGVENVSRGMGGMESVSFLGMLLGTALSAIVVDHCTPLQYSSLLVIFALAGYVASLLIRAKEVQVERKDRLNPFVYIRKQWNVSSKHKGLNAVIFFLSIFWWFATTMQLSLVVYCQEEMLLSQGGPGIMMCICAIGVSLGCLASGWIGQKFKNELLRTPVYGLIMIVGLVGMFLLHGSHYIIFGELLFGVSFVGGFFKVPLDAEIQRAVAPDELDATLAYFNQISFLFMLLASITYYVLTLLLPLRYVFLLMALGLMIASVGMYITNRRNHKS